MSEHNGQALTRRFIENSTSLYEGHLNLTPLEREELFSLEERFSELFYQQNLDASLKFQAGEEEELALAIDNNSSDAGGLDLAVYGRAVQNVISAGKLMSNPSLPNRPVPETLFRIATGAPEDAPEREPVSTPSLILKMTKNSIELVKSSFQGITQVPQTFAFTRSSISAATMSADLASAEKRPRIELKQLVRGKNNLKLEYQLVRESIDELLLIIGFKVKSPGLYRVNLLQENRIIDSKQLLERENSISFGKLSVGYYHIEIKGPVYNRFSVLIENDER